MEFNLTYLGTGSALSMTHYNTNALLEVNGKKYLIDCGISIPYALKDANIKLEDIDGLIITHIHGDHTGGVEWLAYQGKYVVNKKYKLYIADNLLPLLWDKTLAGGMEDSVNEKHTLDMYFDIHVSENLKPFNINGLNVIPFKTTHVKNNDKSQQKPNYSFLLDDRVFYSGDMIFNDELLHYLHYTGVQAFFHDCQLFYLKDGVHTSLDELLTLPSKIKNKIKVVHYGDNIDDFKEIINNNGMEIVEERKTYKF